MAKARKDGRPKVAVIGAGIAGLTAALRLAQRGYKVTVFEQYIHLGGKLGAHRHKIYSCNINQRTAATVRRALNNSKLPRLVRENLARGLGDARRALHPKRKRLGFPLKRDGELLGEDETLIVRPNPPRHAGKEEWFIEDGESRRRYFVALYEREDRGLSLYIWDAVYHEHCYHMFLNWYRNFWELMSDVGIPRGLAFSPRTQCAHLFPGTTPLKERLRTLTDLGAPGSAGRNLLSGVAPPPDMFLWFHSMTDLASQPFNPARLLDYVSVSGFMGSRWYATETSAGLHQYVLTKAFAVPPYLTSAAAYRSFAEFGMRDPHPMLWILNGDTDERLFGPLERALEQLDCTIHKGAHVTKIRVEEGTRRAKGVAWQPWDVFKSEASQPRSPARPLSRGEGGERAEAPGEDEDEGSRRAATRREHALTEYSEDFQYVILAVPPSALASLMEEHREFVPGLDGVRQLQSGVTAALDLYLTRGVPGIPNMHVILRGSRYGLTFFDNAQAWMDDPNMRVREERKGEKPLTCLNVAATDFYMLEGMDKEEAIRAIVSDLKRYLDIEEGDVDFGKSYLQMNENEPLFLNEVGSEQWRPECRTDIPNVFLAGDFCDNPVGIVTVEGAVVSGLQAVRALQARYRDDNEKMTDNQKKVPSDDVRFKPVQILLPETYPSVNAKALKVALNPYVSAAKVWSRAEQLARTPGHVLSPREIDKLGVELLTAPSAMMADWWSFAVDAAQWLAGVPFSED